MKDNSSRNNSTERKIKNIIISLLMVDWREWAPQIVASIIGSSLIVTALTSTISFWNKPLIHISTDAKVAEVCPTKSIQDQYLKAINYTTDFINNGHSQASHVRLTLSYPGTKIVANTAKDKNENMTMKEEDAGSLVVFLPRLAPGNKISIITSICGSSNKSLQNVTLLGDYSHDPARYIYNHDRPFSITATYDDGSNVYTPSIGFTQTHSYFDIQALIIPLPAVLGLLSFAIAFRHKRKNLAKFALNILNDIDIVKRELEDKHSLAIVSTNKWDSSNKDKHRFFKNYKDYELIDNFYESLKKRDCDFSIIDQMSNDESLKKLKERNMNCVTQAQRAYMNIDWTKFYKFDLLSGIPLIVVGSFIITFVAEGIPFFFLWGQDERGQLFPYFTITSFIMRSIIGFLIIGITFRITHGIENYFVHSFSRRIIYLVLSIVIVGLPAMTIILLIENYRLAYEFNISPGTFQFKPVYDLLFKYLFQYIFDKIFSSNDYRFYLTSMSLVFDISRMFLLTWATWAVTKWYARSRIKEKNHNPLSN